MIKYPKIDTLYKRQFTARDPLTGELKFMKKGKGEKNKIIIGDYSVPEFESIKYWTVTEKMDGTNIRISYTSATEVCISQGVAIGSANGKVDFGGRTENALIPSPLIRYLTETFTVEKFETLFPIANSVLLFGEGIGGKIQVPEGQNKSVYGDSYSFVLFDAMIDSWWLEIHKVWELAAQLGIKSVNALKYFFDDEKSRDLKTFNATFIWTKFQIEQFVKSKPKSLYYDHIIEGIVARSHPQMFFRDRDKGPVMFKLKVKDYE